MSLGGYRSRVFVGGTLFLIGAFGGVSQCLELANVPQYGTETARDVILTKYTTTTSVSFGVHFVLLAVAGSHIVRHSKKSVWFLSSSVFAWVIGVSFTAWFAKSGAAVEGLEQILPTWVIFLKVAKSRFVMVLPSIIGLLFVRFCTRKEAAPSN